MRYLTLFFLIYFNHKKIKNTYIYTHSSIYMHVHAFFPLHIYKHANARKKTHTHTHTHTMWKARACDRLIKNKQYFSWEVRKGKHLLSKL